MKNYLILLFLLSTPRVFSQKLAPHQLNDDRLIVIDDTVLTQLTNNEWQLEFVVREDSNGSDTVRYRNRRVRYYADGHFITHDCGSVTWKVLEKKIIRHKPYPKCNLSGSLVGPLGDYGIYAISDTTLMLVKVITSDRKNVQTYHFVNRDIATEWDKESENSFLVSWKVTDLLELKEEGSYEIRDSYGNRIMEGTGKKIDVSWLLKGSYYIIVDDQSEKFFKV